MKTFLVLKVEVEVEGSRSERYNDLLQRVIRDGILDTAQVNRVEFVNEEYAYRKHFAACPQCGKWYPSDDSAYAAYYGLLCKTCDPY